MLSNEVNWENKTILIVKDVEPNYKLLKSSLEKTRVKVVWASTGDKAIGMCEDIPEIDIVLMDIYLPGISGYEATKRIKE